MTATPLSKFVSKARDNPGGWRRQLAHCIQTFSQQHLGAETAPKRALAFYKCVERDLRGQSPRKLGGNQATAYNFYRDTLDNGSDAQTCATHWYWFHAYCPDKSFAKKIDAAAGNPDWGSSTDRLETQEALDRAQFNELLSERPWRSFKRSRRHFVHPSIGSESNIVSEKVVLHDLDRFIHGEHNALLISGDVASGKSSICEILISSWRDKYGAYSPILVLPLSSDYVTGENWDRDTAIEKFSIELKKVAQLNDMNCLIIVEDAHEAFGDNQQRFFLPELSVALNDRAKIVLTSRGGGPFEGLLASVKEEFLERWASTFNWTTMATDSASVAASLTSRVATVRHRPFFERLFFDLGKSLVGLAAALRIYQNDGKKVVNMELAFRSVKGEMDRLVDPEDDFVRSKGDISVVKAALCTAWMLGMTDGEFSEPQFAAMLGVTDASDFLRFLERRKEVSQLSDLRYRCLRHPAWGMLTLQAMDEYGELNRISKLIYDQCISEVPYLDGKSPKNTAEAVMSGILFNEIVPVADLSFVATGRFIHDEFARSANNLLSYGSTRTGPVSDPIGLRKAIVSSIRRYNPLDVELRQEMMDDAVAMMEQAIELAKSNEQQTLESIGDTHLLYEAGYIEHLHGDFRKAAQLFKQSRVLDQESEGRLKYALQSGCVELKCAVYSEDMDYATELVEKLSDMANRLSHDASDQMDVARFLANFATAKFEYFMEKRSVNKCQQEIESYQRFVQAAGIVSRISIREARLSLLREDYGEAMRQITISKDQAAIWKEVELYNAVCRIEGDAHLGMEDTVNAVKSYRVILPNPELAIRHFDIETLRVRDRTELLASGTPENELLKSVSL